MVRIPTRRLCRESRFLFATIAQVILYMSVCFLQPTLALYLESFGYGGLYIGLCFAIPTLIYAATTPLTYLISANLKKRNSIFIGFFFMVVAMLLVAPSRLLDLEASPSMTISGLSLLGFACATVVIPIMPEMIDSIEESMDV